MTGGVDVPAAPDRFAANPGRWPCKCGRRIEDCPCFADGVENANRNRAAPTPSAVPNSDTAINRAIAWILSEDGLDEDGREVACEALREYDDLRRRVTPSSCPTPEAIVLFAEAATTIEYLLRVIDYELPPPPDATGDDGEAQSQAYLARAIREAKALVTRMRATPFTRVAEKK